MPPGLTPFPRKKGKFHILGVFEKARGIKVKLWGMFREC